MYGTAAPFSYSPRGFVPEEQPSFRRGFQQDEPRNSPFQRNSPSRPSGKAIYSQRKEHIETLNKEDNVHYRVEHLFTCELISHEANSLDECIAKLKNLDAKGRIWPQDMILDVQGGYLQLNDIETKAELESLPLASILKTSTVLDCCAYNSLLAVVVQQRFRRSTQVYIFQCEEVGAEFIKRDLDKVVQGAPAHVDNHSNQLNFRNDREHIPAPWVPGGSSPRAVLDRPPSPLENRPSGRAFEPPPAPRSYAPVDPPPAPRSYAPVDPPPAPRSYAPPPHESHYNAEMEMGRQESRPMTEYTDIQRDTEILNHVFIDVELFMGLLAATVLPQGENGKKKKAISKKKSKTKGAGIPPADQYVGYLQKVKYGFNLLGKLNGHLTNPSAPDYVHILFTTLRIVVPQYAPGISMRVVSPMLTEPALQLLDQETSPEEDQLWRSLGECWNLPRNKWPHEVPPYMPQFSDGWQIPPHATSSQMVALNRSNSQRFPPSPSSNGPPYDPRSSREEQRNDSHWAPPSPRQSGPPLYMRVIYDFVARNSQELSIQKGDVVQVVDKSKQWWIVRNNLQEEGHVPQNVLEPMNESVPMDNPQGSRGRGPPLDLMSSPADVRAWLDYKGFSKMTVQSIGVLSGKQLLGLSRENLRLACPEEGGKMFFQLQPIKSAIALASEPGYGPYNGRH
ncbi:epidermal growth factor receptor kinase substrate 8-like protein 3b isoform X1 [Gadus morhua]|nr:epidermal growth factor receptor kinase substrate 8-like protein 3 isoform X1 [Gadus morhua]XP_030225413.1 epidermal growth factor receptor kinase substrate 8-like protein 3 isoform X1 [Gadus morhua]XP_030225422.1 epidermal growth factor receptor kinase substrate 8-like protein 3 isoform X1 [Gadus morhua]